MITIFIPVFNEEEILERNVLQLLSYLQELDLSYEIIIGSNGSWDNTEQVGLRLEGEFSEVTFFHIPERGPGRAFSQAIQRARGDKIICLDADLSSSIDFIDTANRFLDSVYMVLGSKSLGKQRRNLIRVFGSQMYIALAQVLLSLSFSDYSLGSKAYRREMLLPIAEKIDSWTGYSLELTLYLLLRRKQIIQIPVICEDTRKSRFSLSFEAFYRYRHLQRVWWDLQRKKGWIRPESEG